MECDSISILCDSISILSLRLSRGRFTGFLSFRLRGHLFQSHHLMPYFLFFFKIKGSKDKGRLRLFFVNTYGETHRNHVYVYRYTLCVCIHYNNSTFIIMNVLNHYEVEHLTIGNAIEMDDDHFFCKIEYKDEPFLIRTDVSCIYRKKADPASNFVYVSLTDKAYLEWFEEFYQGVISKFHLQSAEWFEEPMTHHEFECSFINPLKSNIKQKCFDILCKADDTKLNTSEAVGDLEVFPTFHVKGIRFNTKHFMFDIELVQVDQEVKEIKEEVKEVKAVEAAEVDIEEYCPSVEDLEETELDLEEESIYDIYDTINERIKQDMVENIRKLFVQKNLKIKIDLSEVVDDEEPDSE